ncbi:hypothetical protein GON03_06215 [Nocardioides sp. MAH-18]|uniref:Uncharacterized protein n=1 Tax=Nocardioides agri TaxID=2682843 RepID=A0A6L6XNT1_9ACTN|nr:MULTISPECIES: hypothetical protein [unclassified Nocardioides]MBA2953908.1 hypothetical protein [Nocardioides sp. CGMCC 1.13656]MVQ48770.1 hypothetical protein [Nocardioides sp. MAH-18]
MTPDSTPRSQLVLRALVFLGPVVALVATGPAGHGPPWWLVVLVAVLAGAAAVAPDSPVGVGAGLVVLAWWTLSLRDGIPVSVAVAAVALTVGHLAALLASYGPRAMPLDAPTLRLWARRGALVLLTVPGAWLLARVVRGEPEQPGVWVVALAAACLAILGATAAMDVPEPKEPR